MNNKYYGFMFYLQKICHVHNRLLTAMTEINQHVDITF
jgi:hypothetical protein